MSPRLLYLNNALTDGVPEKLDEHFRSLGLQTDVFWAAGDRFPDAIDGYDALFLSPSPTAPWERLDWVGREIALIRNAAARDIPMLGICFGSQILAFALCGPDAVFRRADFETGYVPIRTTPAWANDPLARGMPAEFPLFSWHHDEVRASHPDMRILGASPSCANHIWKHVGHSAWGVQGHPEAGGPHAREWFAANNADLVRSGAPLSRMHAAGFPQTADAMKMFANFAAFVSGHR
ncbi:MAG: type 1 glutamine amidotransferase [Rhizomicrobium sp.]